MLKEADPDLAVVAHLRGVVVKDTAVVFDPLRLVQVDLALFHINAVFAQNVGAWILVLEQQAQHARIACGHRVVDARLGTVLGNFPQAPQGRVDGANGPEVIDKRRVGAEAQVAVLDLLPSGFAVQKGFMAELAPGVGFVHRR